MSKFKPGDHVRYVGSQTPSLKGKTGTVEYPVTTSNVPVRWDDGREYGAYPSNLEMVVPQAKGDPWAWVKDGMATISAAGTTLTTLSTDHDDVNHPSHYTNHPSGVECITVTEHMNFCRGNAIKYIWRAGDKGNEIQDLEKARFYIDREITRLKNGHNA